ncbi:MAG: DMT family transporter [Desulfobacula sp.]|nr:DMT family transporter [Desulfobacula sp.]
MKSTALKSDFILLVVAAIWGLAFVAQRIGMDHVGPFTFNGVRFVLGGLSLVPFVFFPRNRIKDQCAGGLIPSGIISGLVLFCGISLQQVGLVYTTAGKAGFITGLYVVIVPLIGLFIKNSRTSPGTWTGAVLAGIGMYFLSVTKDMDMAFGDLLVFFSAVCFAFHLIIIGRLSQRFDTVGLSLVQCFVCAALSLVAALFSETLVLADILDVALPLLYGGVMSVGVAYSLQIYGQKNSPTSHAAIILCMESVVAALGGWIILDEMLSPRGILGCVLMLAGMLISQLYPTKLDPKASPGFKETR